MAKERVDSEGGKGGKKKEVRLAKRAADKEIGGGGGERGRVVAVDWAVGKDEFKRAQVDAAPEEAEVGSDDEDSEEESDEEEHDDDSDMSPVPEGAEDEDVEMSPEPERHADDDDDELDEEPVGPEPPKGTTLFIRNMSFEATESELYDLFVASCFLDLLFADLTRRFKAFGPVRYARIVFDPTTKRSRGTAFVCFWNDEDAQKVLYESEVLNAGLYGEVSFLLSYCVTTTEGRVDRRATRTEKRPRILCSWPILLPRPPDDSVCTVEYSLPSLLSPRSTPTICEKIETRRELRKLIEGICISCEKEVRSFVYSSWIVLTW